MPNLQRRGLLKGAAASLLPMPAIAQSTRASTLRFVPQANLTILDPVWTTAGVTTDHAYCVFDMLYALDAKLEPQPQMVEGHTVSDDKRTWLLKLRTGLKFHDGEPVRAADCAASILRWGKRDSFGQLLVAASDSIDAADDRTIRIRLKRPFAHVVDALAHPAANGCFIMPERLAKTDANTQVTEMVGSGPYKFLKDEFVAGSSVAYSRFADYVPREEPASWAAGGKRAYMERVEWHIIPDAATAAAALQSGEIDWWEIALPDLLAKLRGDKQVSVVNADPYGLIALLRFNCSQPPFNNAKLRHAVLSAIDQNDYMAAISGGDASAYSTCFSMFACGFPHVREIGTDAMKPPKDLDSARAAVRAAGYNGEKVVVINPTDFPSIGAHGELTADLLKKLGMNVELQETDWGTVVQRRTSREPVEKGGWSIFHTNSGSIFLGNPVLNYYIRGQGATGWFGWFANAEMERLNNEWLDSATDADQDRLFDAIQRVAFEQAPVVPLGRFYVHTAYRRNLTGVIPAVISFPWNIRRT